MPRGRPRLREPHPDRTDDLFGSELACDPLFFERSARASGYTCIAGLDEAGRGPLAGPVVAAAVVLPDGLLIPGLTDSKQVPEPERERLFEVIREQAVCYGIGIADERTIDDVNILQATIIAMERALEAALSRNPITCSSMRSSCRAFRSRKIRSSKAIAAATALQRPRFLRR